MNTYPRYSHRLAAIAGNLFGSPMEGLHFVALASLAAVWSGLAAILVSLPRRALWIVSGVIAVLLLANGLFVHLEIFGRELVGNYFFPQLVAQGIAILVVALALWIERAGFPPVINYLLLGLAVPLLQQFHLLPALEVLGTLTLLVALNAMDNRIEKRWTVFALGVPIVLGSVAATVLSSAFSMIVGISDTRGVLDLKYTPTMTLLASECVIVIALSAFLVWQWLRAAPSEDRTNTLALKYVGLLGLAFAGLCLMQILLLRIGYGSEYACKKYAYGVNTLLVLGIALAATVVARRSKTMLNGLQEGTLSWPVRGFQLAFPGLLVLAAFLTILPVPSAKAIALSEVVSAEHFATHYEASNPPSNPAKYDYAIGLFPNLRIFDYLISIGTLKAPRVGNADDMLNGNPPSKPSKIARIFTREGSTLWDIPTCRQAPPQDGIVVLDGACVLQAGAGSGANFSP